MLKRLLTLPKIVQITTIRNHGQHNKKNVYKTGKLFESVRYYPRDFNEPEEPVFQAAKLFRVQRIKPVKGTPYWERRILKDLGLIEKKSDVAIVKNIPENNARLWKVKHLIEIHPIYFPYGEPTENDINYTFLKENGECIVTKEIKVDDKRIEATEHFEQDPKRIDKETLKKDSRLKWLNPL